MAAFLPVLLNAQSAPADQTELIRTLLDRVQQLEKRVAELERDRPAVAALPEPKQELPVSESSVQSLSTIAAAPAGAEEQTYPRFRMAGFADVNFGGSTRHGSISGFNEGQFVLHINSQLSPKVSVFAELSMTPPASVIPEADMPAHSTGFQLEVERSFIRYDYNDAAKISFGRYHTPVNYWNTAFHHGTWLQTTVSKPELARSFIPVHFVGALGEGTVPVGGLNLSYNAGIGNGRGPTIDRGGDAGDINNNRAWLLNVSARPDKLYALQVGASVYRDELPFANTPVREWLTGYHVVWHRENPEIIAEFANAQHRIAGTKEASNSQSWYVQTAYRFPESHWKPYYRFEYQHIPISDRVFRTVPSLAGSVAGVRWDISSFAAFKFEYRSFRLPDLGRVHYGFIQTSFTF